MNKNAKKWVKALRSGKYKQTTGRLAREGAYCCLGVACELAVKAGVIQDFEPSDGELPEQVALWLGLGRRDGTYEPEEGGLTDLGIQNDQEKKTFKQIAKIIESEPRGMFKEVTK